MRKPLFLVDSFAERPFAGNPAAVLLDGADLDSPAMQKIAAELRHSETAFPSAAREPQSAFHLRWFSPVSEVGFCGHATLATLHVLVEEAKRIRVPEQGVTRLSFTCKAGRLRAELWREAGKLRAMFETPAQQFTSTPVSAELLAVLGLVPGALDPNLVPQKTPRAGSDASNLFVALRDAEALARARPDFKALAALCLAEKLGGVCLYATNPEKGVDAVVRYFLPHGGVDEDPVTGSACAALGLLLQEKLPLELPRKMVFAQGAHVGRPGRVHAEVRPEEEPGQIRAWVGGPATIVLRGELDLGK
jgi:PhzF family phenazine biosynthesis protein